MPINAEHEKRGLTTQQAMEYVGVKRRTWETLWVPRLVGIRQGVCVIFDRHDVDRVFDEFKAEAVSSAERTGMVEIRPSTPSMAPPHARSTAHTKGLSFAEALKEMRLNLKNKNR